MKSINEELISILKEKTPEKSNTAALLLDILPLGREAVYRRLRGEIPFTFEEAVTVCRKLNISLDLLMGIKQDKTYAFHLNTLFSGSPFEDYFNMLHRMIDSIDYIKDDPTVYLYRAHKTIPQEFLYNYKFLSQVYMYILYFQLFLKSSGKVERFSEIEFPKEIFEAQKESIRCVHGCNSSLILDKRIIVDFIDIVKYFQFLGMISDSDIAQIKEELYKLIEDMQKCAVTGQSLLGKQMYIYVSNISFDCSYTSLESENFQVASIGVYCVDYLSCQNDTINENNMTWIKSLIRFSNLISISDELKRKEFFQTQLHYIDTML